MSKIINYIIIIDNDLENIQHISLAINIESYINTSAFIIVLWENIM